MASEGFLTRLGLCKASHTFFNHVCSSQAQTGCGANNFFSKTYNCQGLVGKGMPRFWAPPLIMPRRPLGSNHTRPYSKADFPRHDRRAVDEHDAMFHHVTLFKVDSKKSSENCNYFAMLQLWTSVFLAYGASRKRNLTTKVKNPMPYSLA
jgi:hypothetical protein